MSLKSRIEALQNLLSFNIYGILKPQSEAATRGREKFAAGAVICSDDHKLWPQNECPTSPNSPDTRLEWRLCDV